MSASSTRFANQVAIITGGGQGIGFGIAKRLREEGATIVVIDCNEKLQSAVAEVGELFVVDVTSLQQMEECFAAVKAKYGRIDVLVQAAGITGKTGIFTMEVDPADFDRVMNINLKGVFNGCKAALPYMTAQKYGRIINIASISGKEGNAGMLAYSTSKAAVIGLTKVIGKEYAESGVTCNAIAPAVVQTAMVAAMPAEQVKYMTDKIPMKRCGQIEEIAALISFMASSESSFTTGFCFDATGGRAVY